MAPRAARGESTYSTRRQSAGPAYIRINYGGSGNATSPSATRSSTATYTAFAQAIWERGESTTSYRGHAARASARRGNRGGTPTGGRPAADEGHGPDASASFRATIRRRRQAGQRRRSRRRHGAGGGLPATASRPRSRRGVAAIEPGTGRPRSQPRQVAEHRLRTSLTSPAAPRRSRAARPAGAPRSRRRWSSTRQSGVSVTRSTGGPPGVPATRLRARRPLPRSTDNPAAGRAVRGAGAQGTTKRDYRAAYSSST